MKFTEAIQKMKYGHAVRRSCWLEDSKLVIKTLGGRDELVFTNESRESKILDYRPSLEEIETDDWVLLHRGIPVNPTQRDVWVALLAGKKLTTEVWAAHQYIHLNQLGFVVTQSGDRYPIGSDCKNWFLYCD